RPGRSRKWFRRRRARRPRRAAPAASSLVHPDLEQRGPELAGNEQPPAVGVPGDAVEHVVVAAPRIQTSQVHPAGYLAAGGVDAGDVILVPDVGPYFTIDVFQFVEARQRAAVVADLDAARLLEGGR